MNDYSTTMKFPIKEEWLPNITLRVDLIGASPRLKDSGEEDKENPPRPAFAVGSLPLKISIKSKNLTVKVTPKDEKTKPGSNNEIEVLVNDIKGNPVENAEICVIVVDESILALASYSINNPLPTFYPSRNDGTQSFLTRSKVMLLR